MKQKWMILSVAIVLAINNACTDSRPTEQRKNEADSLIDMAERSKNHQRVLALVDSLEDAGAISAVRANYRRAVVYYDQEQVRAEEYYYKLALASEVRDEEDLHCYINCVTNLTSRLLSKGDDEGALRTILAAIERMKQTGNDTPEVMGGLYNSVGNCQMNLGRLRDAADSYNRAYDYYRQAVATDSTGRPYRSVVVGLCNTAVYYLNNKCYAESMPWVARADTMLSHYEARKTNIDHTFVDDTRSSLLIYQATAYQGMGRNDEAAKAYEAYLRTDYAKTDFGQLDATDYLISAHRYAEAADHLQRIDEQLQEWGMDYTLDNIQGYLLPKYRANLGAGRRDSALMVALRLCDALDSAIAWQKRSDAAELATIYDTQEKERTITEQKASLSRQRLIATTAISLIVVLALLLYLQLRRRAAQRLAKKNEELTIANARAEESSKMKSNFIQQISHEIRTPLNILSGFTQIVTTPGMELDDATKSDINRQITENTDRITSLVNKMLELSDANSRSVIERTDDVPAIQIAAQAAEYSGISLAQHLDFDMQLGEGTDSLMLHTNLQQATRALTLLLDNAQKFTHAAEAHHRIETVTQKEKAWLKLNMADGMACFTVEDTGIGVPTAEAERIFEEFVQLDEYYDGTGIGLTVARSIARRLGGDVRIDTAYTGGARFIMSLPVT